jgi:uncharacterized phage protein (TIGR02218 family)
LKSIPTELQTHLSGSVTTLAVCWRVERQDGVLILGTEHDRDIIVEADSPSATLSGTYVAQAGITGSDVRSTSDMAVDNMEVQGAINNGDISLVDLSAADIEAGLFDHATVTLFLCNWQAPDEGQVILRTGNIGEIRRTSEYQYHTELRGLAQRLSQKIVRTYGSGCDAEFGDSRCTVDVAALTLTGTVNTVTSNREFTVTLSLGHTVGAFDGGLITWTSGDNDTFSMEVRKEDLSPINNFNLYLPMPRDIQSGDTFTIQPGCDKSAAMCKGAYSNLVNFRGHGAWVPGIGELGVFGGQTSERRSQPADFLTWPRT